MSAPVSTVGCRACGAVLGPYEVVCPTCGAKTKQAPALDDLSSRQRELAGIAGAALASAMKNIRHARTMGVKVSLAEDLMKMARESAEEMNFAVALELASKSAEEAETATIQYEALQARIARAKRLIAAAREEGIELDDALELLEMAHEAAIAGDYKSALRLAIKAGKRASDKRTGYKAWKVEIGDWLK